MKNRVSDDAAIEAIMSRCASIGRHAAEVCVLSDPLPWEEGHADILSAQLIVEAHKDFRKYRKDVTDQALALIFDSFHARVAEIVAHMPIETLEIIEDGEND